MPFHAFPPFFIGKKRSFVASILETLLKNSSSSHKGYLCKAAKVSALVRCLPRKCQLRHLYCGRHGGRLCSPTLLLNCRSLLLCTRVATFPTLSPPFSLERCLSSTYELNVPLFARKPGLLNADFMEVTQEGQTVIFQVIYIKSDLTRHKALNVAHDASCVLF